MPPEAKGATHLRRGSRWVHTHGPRLRRVTAIDSFLEHRVTPYAPADAGHLYSHRRLWLHNLRGYRETMEGADGVV